MPSLIARAFQYTQQPRIFCIGRNYAEHIQELGNDSGRPCVVFMKPLSALVASEQAICLPKEHQNIHYEAELVVGIGHSGRNLTPEQAPHYIDALGLGLDLTLRDLQNELKSTGEPWEQCKAFDHSAPLGPMQTFRNDIDLQAIEFTLSINGQARQHGQTRLMMNDIAHIIAQISQTWSLLPGDLIYTGTPKGVGPLQTGDVLKLTSPQLPTGQWTVA